ncbi:MAG: M14 family zinc carboxypeptidase [Janthinobacterium lividum]
MPRWISIFAVLALLTFAGSSSRAEKNLVRPPGTTRYGAMVHLLTTLRDYDQAHENRMTLASIGSSVRGRNLWMVTLGSGPKRIFYLCRQHGHEPASTEGALAFISELVKADPDTPMAGYLKSATIYIVLMANPDGSEAFLRHNARDVDLNRDWLKRTQPETRALYLEISNLHPDLMTDQHELYPNDTRPDFTEVVGVGSAATPPVIAASTDAQNVVSGAMDAEGFPNVRHQVTDKHPARLVHRFSSIVLDVPTILFETNRLPRTGRTVARRAAAHEAFMLTVLRYEAGDREALVSEGAAWAAAHPAVSAPKLDGKGSD